MNTDRVTNHTCRGAIALLFSISQLAADPILDIKFEDPNAVLSGFPEGVSLAEIATPPLKDTAISAGVGGSAFVHIDSAEWIEAGPPPKTIQKITESTLGMAGLLRLVNETHMPGTKGMVRIVPEGPHTSLASFSRVEGGKVLLDGGFDLFFRYEEDPPTQPFQVPNLLSAQGGLNFLIEADGKGGLVAVLSDPKDEMIFDTNLDGTADEKRVETAPATAVPIEPGSFYHLGVLFRPAADGTITMKAFLKTGTGPIKTDEDTDLVAQATFRVMSENPEKSLSADAIRLQPNSRSSPQKVTLDLAAFRIYKPAPPVFLDLAGKE